jgi:hypothetical protein
LAVGIVAQLYLEGLAAHNLLLKKTRCYETRSELGADMRSLRERQK